MLPEINRRLGLHQSLEVTYVVDGYLAEFWDDDGNHLVAWARACSIEVALVDLEERLTKLRMEATNHDG
jgi:hypothetical protein